MLGNRIYVGVEKCKQNFAVSTQKVEYQIEGEKNDYTNSIRYSEIMSACFVLRVFHFKHFKHISQSYESASFARIFSRTHS